MQALDPDPPAVHDALPKARSAQELIAEHFIQLRPIPIFHTPGSGRRRITLVADSLSRGSLMGGVGTAVLLAAHLARARDARLRVLTRAERPAPSNLAGLTALYGIELNDEIEFAFSSIWESPGAIDVFDDELFVTMSWWATRALLSSVSSERVLYLLQEDERMFYPGCDMHLRCSRLLANDSLNVVVNTRGLLDHLVGTGLEHLRQRATSFEPAFPDTVYFPRQRSAGKRRLMFYAGPGHERNLFYFGLGVLDAALARGMLDSEHWELLFVGTKIPELQMCDGSRPAVCDGLSWQDYAELAGTIDLALTLMYTPHPGDPPLDLAASGAVVVSNRFGNKNDLSGLCRNILLSELNVDAMLDTLAAGIRLAQDDKQRRLNHGQRQLPADWSVALQPVIDRFCRVPNAWA